MNKREIVLIHLTWILHSIKHASLQLLSEAGDQTDELQATISPNSYLVSVNEVPHHVLVVYNNVYCSGTLVHSRMVLTAASCLLQPTVRPVIKLGVSSIPSIGQMIPVVEVKIHEYYKHLNILDNDIAILVLKRNVLFGQDVKKAVLLEHIAVKPGIVIEVSGWGSTNLPSGYVNHLLKTEMMVMSVEQCKSVIGPLITHSNFCAQYLPIHRLSDNGGGAVINKYNLVGILSFGGIREDEKVAILTNVSRFHRWISINVKLIMDRYCVPETSNLEEYTSGDSEEFIYRL